MTATNIKKMCNQAVGNYSHGLEFVADCYKIQKMCDEAGQYFSFCNTLRLWML